MLEFATAGSDPAGREQVGIRVVTKYLIDSKGMLYAYLFIKLNKYSR